MSKTKLAIFEGKKIRRQWDEKKELWYFSVVDIVQALTDQFDFTRARKYWNKLAECLRNEGSEVVTKCHQLKMQASDGKFYLTDAADIETLFRLIQSIPSPKAEPLKLWLAQVGYERLEETADPELAINPALKSSPAAAAASPRWPGKKLKKKPVKKRSAAPNFHPKD